MEESEERVNPNVLMATLLDDANSHLAEISKNLLRISSLGGGDRKDEIKHLERLVRTAQVLYPQKSIPYSSEVTIPNPTSAPTNENDTTGYTIENVYNNNGNKVIERMTLVCDGPGRVFYRVVDGKMKVNQSEETLNVGDQRPLFNVYEVRLRTNVPLTAYRLYEGEFRTGSFARSYKANTEVRPTLQSNEKIKTFSLGADSSPVLVPIVPPVPAVYLGPSFHAPIGPGVTTQFVDIETGLNMPYIVPQGYILEAFSALADFTTNWTLRGYYELIPGSGIYNHTFVIPVSQRGAVNWVLNINPISTEVLDPTGASAGGRGVLFTVTNDDPVNNMVGEIDIIMLLRKLS